MIEVLARAGLFEEFSDFLFVLARSSGLVAFCPIFSSTLLPARLRLGLALMIAFVLLPIAPEMPAWNGQIGSVVASVTRELFIGLGLGLAARAVFEGLEGAARLVAGQSGFSLARMVDPVTGNQSIAPALFQSLLATALILAADLHHLFIRGLMHSYTILPPAAELPNFSGMGQGAAHLGARLFSVTVELAAPALVVTFAVDLVLVLVGRAIPQVPILIVGYPLKVTAGLVAMVILAFVTGSAIRWIGNTFTADAELLLGTFGS